MADAKVTQLTEMTTPVDADVMLIVDDPAGTPATQKVTWANIKATLKTYFDTFYLPLAGGTLSGNLAMGDQDITGVGAVRFTQQLDNGSKTASFSVDFATDQHQKVTLTANTMTLTLDTTDIGVGVYTLEIVNGGLATLTWASETGSITWAGGAAPTLTSSGTDVVSLLWTGSVWRGQASLAFA